jgi:hypothetical protein
MNYLLSLTPSDIQIHGMAHPHSLRHPLFRRRWFTDEVIINCVRWYLPTASRITSGSNWRHLNSPEIDGTRNIRARLSGQASKVATLPPG